MASEIKKGDKVILNESYMSTPIDTEGVVLSVGKFDDELVAKLDLGKNLSGKTMTAMIPFTYLSKVVDKNEYNYPFENDDKVIIVGLENIPNIGKSPYHGKTGKIRNIQRDDIDVTLDYNDAMIGFLPENVMKVTQDDIERQVKLWETVVNMGGKVKLKDFLLMSEDEKNELASSLLPKSIGGTKDDKKDKFNYMYDRLLKVAPDLLDMLEKAEYPSDVYGKSQYRTEDFGGDDAYMYLAIEGLDKDSKGRYELSISHYYIQNGDMMCDPCMTVRMDVENKTLEALNFKMDGVIGRGIVKNVYGLTKDGKEGINVSEKNSQNKFLNTWSSNWVKQGHKVEFRALPEDEKEPIVLSKTSSGKPIYDAPINKLRFYYDNEIDNYTNKDLYDIRSYFTIDKNISRVEGVGSKSDVKKYLSELSDLIELRSKQDKTDHTFTYKMLSRLQQDNDYFLGNGGRSERNLWANNVDDQIKEMKRLWDLLPENAKPDWLSYDDILDYESKMKDEETELPVDPIDLKGLLFSDAKVTFKPMNRYGKAIKRAFEKEGVEIKPHHRFKGSAWFEYKGTTFMFFDNGFEFKLDALYGEDAKNIKEGKDDSNKYFNYLGAFYFTEAGFGITASLIVSRMMEAVDEYISEHNTEITAGDFVKRKTGGTARYQVLRTYAGKLDLILVSNGLDFDGLMEDEFEKVDSIEVQELENQIIKTRNLDYKKSLLEDVKSEYPIVVEWTEADGDMVSKGIKSIKELESEIRKGGFTEEPFQTYVKWKIHFKGYPSPIRIDVSKIGQDYNFEKENLIDYLEREYSNFDWSEFKNPQTLDEVFADDDMGILDLPKLTKEEHEIVDAFRKPIADAVKKSETYSKISLDPNDYKNQYELNRAIEQLLDLNSDDYIYGEPEKDFIYQYAGYGGLEKFGARGKQLLWEYYTPKVLIEKMWGLAYKYGFNTGKVLEPSVGVGRFLDYASSNDEVVAYEISDVSAKICSIIHPKTKIIKSSFAEHFYNGNVYNPKFEKDFDLVIGNPPYGKFVDLRSVGESKRLGNSVQQYEHYFILRGLDTLKSGGLLVYVSTSNLFTKGYESIKEKISERADLIDAYLLPNKTFKTTEIGTSLIVLRRK